MNLFLKSIMGGIMIAIASVIYLSTGGVIGAILFSIGLLVILNMGFKLFTGTIGYIDLGSLKSINENLLVLFGNIIGACGILLFPQDSAIPIVIAKLSTPLFLVLIKGIICGIFIYVAVSCFKNGKDYMIPVCVTGFILFGAEHCIADLCYVLAAGAFSYDIFIFLIVVTLGNAIGAILIDKL